MVALQIAVEGIDSNGVTGNAKLEANGPQEALKLRLSSELHHATQGEVPLDATATLDASGKQVAVATLHAQYKGQPSCTPPRYRFRSGTALPWIDCASACSRPCWRSPGASRRRWI